MKPFVLFIASAIILAALATAFPGAMLSPGTLLKGHQELQGDCMKCHKPFGGAKSHQCINCHKQDAIGIKTVAGRLIAKDTKKVLFHQGVDAASCIECHAGHIGKNEKSAKPFMHDALSRTLQKDCITCHKNQKPDDNLHQFTKGSCRDCHDRRHWKPATFDHRKLDGLNGKQCISCHKDDQPIDGLHSKSPKNCATCHSSNAWKPATFNHSRYFTLDGDHRASCATCHTDANNYKKYTCYNCHEHSASNIASQHREEGIYNYQNCAKCHRSGDGEGEHGREGGQRNRERGGDDDD